MFAFLSAYNVQRFLFVIGTISRGYMNMNTKVLTESLG